MYSFNTLSHQELNLFRELFYQNNQKIIKDELSDYLTPMGLAAWFMDDGSKTGCNYRFATDGFSEEDNYKLQAILKKKFDLNVRVLEYKKYHYLFLNKQNTIKMTEIIKPFIVGCMKYKLIEPVTPGS